MRLVKIREGESVRKLLLTDSDLIGMSPIAKYFHCQYIEENVLQTFNEFKNSYNKGKFTTAFVDKLMLKEWKEIYVRNKC